MNCANDCINRQPLHDEIARDIAEFQAKGGEVEILTQPPRRSHFTEFNGGSGLSQRAVPESN